MAERVAKWVAKVWVDTEDLRARFTIMNKPVRVKPLSNPMAMELPNHDIVLFVWKDRQDFYMYPRKVFDELFEDAGNTVIPKVKGHHLHAYHYNAVDTMHCLRGGIEFNRLIKWQE
jgi:hypothetical protein